MKIDFHAVFERAPNAYMVLDRQLRYVTANAAYLRATMTARVEDLIGKSFLDAFPQEADGKESANARLLRESFERVLATRAVDEVALIEYRMPRREGDRIVEVQTWWSATHTPLLDEQGEVEHILQHTVDVTELHRLEESVRANEALPPQSAGVTVGVMGRAQRVQEENRSLEAERKHLVRLFDQAPGFVCFLSGPDHVFTLANKAYYQLVGHRELLGKPLRQALPELAGQGYYELMDKVFSTGKPFIGHGMRAFVQRQADSPLEEIFVDLVYQPIVDPSGAISGILVQGQDITVQTRLADERTALLAREQSARAEAERANRLKDELLAAVSHELRTPLNAMLGWVVLLRGGTESEEQRGQALEAIERNARMQSQVINDLLDASLMFTGKLELNLENLDTASVVADELKAVAAAAEAKGLTLEAALEKDAVVAGDRGRLQQVVSNLLSNAVKFTPKGGRVEARVERSGDDVEITVLDTGAGIHHEFLPHVFDRFRQADGSSARAHGGMGLGLAIVQHIVTLHGGSVFVHSRGPGAGATFTVRIPAASTPLAPEVVVENEKPAPAPAPSPSRPTKESNDGAPRLPLAGLNILVVDDEPDARDLVSALLTSDGAEVETASSAAEGFAAFRRRVPDLLVSDVGMPQEDGYDFIRRIRALPVQEGGRVPAVALTAYTRSVDRMQALVAGFKAHVPKPITPAELRAVLTSLLPSEKRGDPRPG